MLHSVSWECDRSPEVGQKRLLLGSCLLDMGREVDVSVLYAAVLPHVAANPPIAGKALYYIGQQA